MIHISRGYKVSNKKDYINKTVAIPQLFIHFLNIVLIRLRSAKKPYLQTKILFPDSSFNTLVILQITLIYHRIQASTIAQVQQTANLLVITHTTDNRISLKIIGRIEI